MKDIFISFIEEAIMNPGYSDYIAGRIEVSRRHDEYPSEEIRFFTKKVEEFYTLRDAWDMLEISDKDLEYIKKIVRDNFYEH